MFSLSAHLVFAWQRDSFPSFNVQSYYPLQPSARPPNPIPLAAGFYFAPRILECRLPVGEYSKLANVGTAPEHCCCARYSSSCMLAKILCPFIHDVTDRVNQNNNKKCNRQVL
jgi:hypothetical protein